MAICELRHVTKSYGEGATRVDAIKDVSLVVQPEEFTVFSGPSGSGKTTLLNQIGCLDRPSEGELLIEGVSTASLSDHALAALRAHKIGFIFQSFNLIPVLTALENVELALQLAGHTTNVRERAQTMFPKVALAGLEHRRPNQLSGGQQQRVAIARALVKEPLIVIADEPTANLDSENGEQILALMEKLNAELGTTFLISTHDPRVMVHAKRRIVMKDGQIASDQDNHARATPAEVGEEGATP